MKSQDNLRELYEFSHEKIEEKEFNWCLNSECRMRFINNGKHIEIRNHQNDQSAGKSIII